MDVVKCISDHLTGTVIKIAICTPLEAAQILESVQTPNARRVKCLARTGMKLKEIINPETDPDRAEMLMWLGDDKTAVTVVKVARLVDELGEKMRNILLPGRQVWPREIEARYKGMLFMEAIKALDGIISPKEFTKKSGEFKFDLSENKIEIEISAKSDGVSTTSMKSYGKLSRRKEDRTWSIWINEEKASDGWWPTWILFHETIHLKQMILRNLQMEKDLEDSDIFLTSPKMDGAITESLFSKALECLL